jgi:O-antigen/teichoic acid export membrane protein
MSAASTYRVALTASSIYFLCEGLRIAAGFLTMPLLTRTLTREEYGLLNLTFATVGILALLGRLGFAEATTRFYYQYQQRGTQHLREFFGTMLAGSFLTATLVALGTVLALPWIVSDANARRCLQAASAVVVIRSVLGVIYQTYRAQERPLAFTGAQLAARYVSLAIVIALLLFQGLSTYGVILATVIGEGLVVLISIAEIGSRGALGQPRLSREHASAAFAYGTPLAVGLHAAFFLDYGDRFLIERFLGLGAVATYSVPYDIVSTLAAAVFGSLKMALMPVVFRVWETEGASATSELVSRLLTYSIALAIPAVALCIVTSEDLIVFLSSAKYSGAGALTAYLAPGVVLGELNFLVAAGLLLGRGTMTLGGLTVGCCALNLALNALLLPRWGLAGAASATTIAYAALMVATYRASRSTLALRVQPVVLAAAVLATGLMLLSLSMLGQVSGHPFVNLLVRGMVGAVIAALCISVFTPEIRELAWMRVLGRKASLRSAS